MLNNLKYFIPAFIVLCFATIASAAPWYTYHASMLPVDSTENIGTSTNRWNEGWFNNLNISGTCTGCGGSSFDYPFPSNATTTNITFSNGLTGNLTGNADTATALQTARNINGVSFNGTADITINAASSTLLGDSNTWTGRQNFDKATTTQLSVGNIYLYSPSATTNFITPTTTNGSVALIAAGNGSASINNSALSNAVIASNTSLEITAPNGVVISTDGGTSIGTLNFDAVLSGPTYSFPNLTGVVALGSYTTGFTSGHIPYGASGLLATSSGLSFNSSTNTLTATRLSSTHATTTNQDITGLLTFNGVTASTWAGFCTTITGGSGLCDGTDDTGSSAYDFPLTGNATSTLTQFNGGLTSYASTTIGAGGAKTGLTISGNATTTGVIRGPSGAEAAATYSFTTDDNTGMFLVSGGTLGFAIDGTGRFAVNSSGIYPYSNGGGSLGLSGTAFANAYLTSTSFIDFGSNDVRLTHSTGNLTLSTGDRLTLTNASTTNVSVSNTFGVASTSPWSALSVGTGAASSSITVAEYKYGATGNVATSTTANIDCRSANQIAWPIGSASATLTLTGLTPGQSCRVIIQNPAGTGGGVTWAVQSGAILTWAGGTVPTRTTTANKMDVYSFIVTMGSSTPMVVLGAQSANF